MHRCKEYSRLIQSVQSNPDFDTKKSGRKNTLKITHLSTGTIRIVHPGPKALKPLEKWLKTFKT